MLPVGRIDSGRGIIFACAELLAGVGRPAKLLAGERRAACGADLFSRHGRLTAGDYGPPFGFGVPEPTGTLNGADTQSPGADQTSRPGSSSSPGVQDEKQGAEVNPLTGLAVASPSNYSPLTLNERWQLYLKMTYTSAGPYFSPLVNALALDQVNDTPRQWGGGFPGFGRRLASRAANSILQGTFQAPLAAILHEDVRYITTRRRSIPRPARCSLQFRYL